MITKSNLIKYILKESGDFAQYLKSSDVNVKQEDNYTTLAELARYILKSFKAKEADKLRESFRIIDDVLDKGDAYVKEAITIGLLETLQNNISWEKNIKQEEFLPYLPKTLKEKWGQIIDFWENK